MPARKTQKINTGTNRQKWRNLGVQQTQNRPNRISYNTFENRLNYVQNITNEQREEIMHQLMPTVSRMFRESTRQGHKISSLKWKNMMYESGDYEICTQPEVSSGVQERVNRLQREVSDARQLIQVLRTQAQAAAKERKDEKIEKEEGMTCAICYEPFMSNQVMATAPGPCTSFYCLECLHTLIEYRRHGFSSSSSSTSSTSSPILFECPCCRKPCDKYLTLKYNKNDVVDLMKNGEEDEQNEDDVVDKKEEDFSAQLGVDSPLCDKCQVFMQIKTSRTGNKFYSCPNWTVTKCPAKSFYDK